MFKWGDAPNGRIGMTAAPPIQEELEHRLETLVEVQAKEPGDQLGAKDEREYFRLVDRAAEDPKTDARVLEALGRRYAHHFLVPFLRGDDAVGIISEVAALIEIHHRGTLRLYDFNETDDMAEAVISFQRIGPRGRRSGPTRFDIALVKEALASRYGRVEVLPVPSRGHVGERIHIRLQR